jgi:hypothetical protein
MPTSDRTKGTRGRAKTPRSTGSEWLPWGLYDDSQVPELSEETIQEAATQLNVTDEAKTAELRGRLRNVAVTYCRYHRDVVKPGPRWFRKQVEPIKKATERLYQLIHNHPGGIGLTPLTLLTQMRMQRPLRGRIAVGSNNIPPESIEHLLKHFTRVCDECLKRKGLAGAKKQIHLQATVEGVAKLWEDFTGKPVGLSLDTDIGTLGRIQFTYPGPHFVHLILTAIDPGLDLAQVATALRNALSAPRAENSAET